jgi:hypothetical protein
MGLGFVKRMLDEAIDHCRQRLVTGKSLFSYDQVQAHLSRLQANFTVLSAFSRFSAGVAGIENDLTTRGLEANVIKTVTTDMMQESSQTLLTLVGAKGYKLNHISGRGTVDSRPFQIFEGANDILYNQIGEAVLKAMRSAKESNLFNYLSNHNLANKAAQLSKDWVSFDVDMTLPQRKVVELGKLLSRVFSLNFVLDMENTSFHTDNPHCHLVYNRIGYDGKVISSQGDYKRNEIATKRLKDKYGLTYAEDKGKTNVTKLHDSERIKYEIYHAVKQALKRARTWKELVVGLALQGIKLEFVGRGGKMKSAGDIQGIRLTKDGLTFKGSQISREFSFAKLNAILGGNSPDTGVDLEVKKQNQAPSNRNRKEQEPSNMAFIESNGLGLFSSFGESVPEEQIPYDELLRKRKKKKKRKGLGL